MPEESAVKKIVILGGGFGGIYTALELEKRRPAGVAVTLISCQNFYLMTPMLFEAASGVLAVRHVLNPIRPLLRRTRFIEAEVDEVDLNRREVYAHHPTGEVRYEVSYDQLVVAVGGSPNYAVVPGAESALSFKTLEDAAILRDRIVDMLELASAQPNKRARAVLLTFVIVGAGLVGVELAGELSHAVHKLLETYPSIDRSELRFHLIQGAPHIVPELDRQMIGYCRRVLENRGVDIRTETRVQRIEGSNVYLPGDVVLEAGTVVYTAGLTVSPLVDRLSLAKDRKGRISTDPTMRSISRPEVWAVGDCAAIPDPTGRPYPTLAQHALREAKTLGSNLRRAIRGEQPKPFVYSSRGTLVMLGGFRGVGKIFRFHVRGIIAWWIWRTYYLMRIPRWERRLRVVINWTTSFVLKPDPSELMVPARRKGLMRGEPPLVREPAQSAKLEMYTEQPVAPA